MSQITVYNQEWLTIDRQGTNLPRSVQFSMDISSVFCWINSWLDIEIDWKWPPKREKSKREWALSIIKKWINHSATIHFLYNFFGWAPIVPVLVGWRSVPRIPEIEPANGRNLPFFGHFLIYYVWPTGSLIS